MAGLYPYTNYKVLFTPLIGENTYGSSVDVTADIDLTDFIKSIGSIKREIDNGDYDFGILTFGDISLNAINYSRKFNTPEDYKSIFRYKRDRCKVEIVYYNNNISSTRFKGIINDDATRIDITNDTVRFKILSLDSIFRQVNVPSGAIVAGDLFSTAIKKILNVPEVTTTLSYSSSNVNVDLDIEIDDGEVFSNLTAKTALDDLLLASNSILYVDNSDVIHVKSRSEGSTIYSLYGGSDYYGRENIINIKNYNTGVQRAFNSIKVNDNNAEATNDAWVAEYGFRQKSLSFDFITTLSKEQQIADKILLEFHVPKEEVEIEVKTDDIRDIDLFDVVKVDYGFRVTPNVNDDIMPFYGQAEYDKNYYAISSGSFRILPKQKWKVTSIDEDLSKMTTKLRLKVTGREKHEGYF